MRRLLTVALLALAVAAPASAAIGERLVLQAEWPAAFTFDPNGRIFYGDRFTGEIRIYDPSTQGDTHFFTLPHVGTDGEQGLLGLALSDEVAVILRREKKTAILVTHDIGEAVSMAERVIVLSRRPGRVKSDHAIRFAAAERPTPLAARNAPEFNTYFNTLWQELEVHVEG